MVVIYVLFSCLMDELIWACYTVDARLIVKDIARNTTTFSKSYSVEVPDIENPIGVGLVALRASLVSLS